MERTTREQAAAALEARVLALRERGELSEAVGLLFAHYGAELQGYLLSCAHQRALADEAYSVVAESALRGIAAFAGRASLRTWLYVIARRALSRVRHAPHARPERNLPLSHASQTMDGARALEPHDGLGELRSTLNEADQALLTMYVDRRLSWSDVARSFAPDKNGVALARESARLRKRFELIKRKLRDEATRRGLLE